MNSSGLLLPKNTLAYQMSRPLFQNRNFGDVRLKDVVASIRNLLANGDYGPMDSAPAVPETCALDFYGRNHGVALIQQRYGRHTPLPDYEYAFVRKYVDTWNIEAVRAFYYLMLIITREFRHGGGSMAPKGPEMAAFHKTIKNSGSSGAVSHLYQSPPDVSLAHYTEAVMWQFTNLSYGGSYGGKPWANIAECCHRFVTGDYSAEIMLDTNWTLSHNNGPIFNKGMLYTTYNGPRLLRILDVQRSGQIPQMTMSDSLIQPYVTMGFKDDMVSLADRYDLDEQVDWQKVVDLGALGNYHQEVGSYTPKTLKPKTKTPSPKTFTESGEDFYVMPGLTVQKIKMKRMAA